MQQSAAQRALAVPELLERIVAHVAYRPVGLVLPRPTLRRLRLVSRMWAALVDDFIFDSITLQSEQGDSPICMHSGFNLRELVERVPGSSLPSKTRFLNCNRNALTPFLIEAIRLGANLRDLSVVDLTMLAEEHAKSPLALPNLAALRFEPLYRIRDAQKRAQSHDFLASLDAHRAVRMYLGEENRSLEWFKLDELFSDLAPRYTSLALFAVGAPMPTATLTALLAKFSALHTLEIRSDYNDSTPDMVLAFPNTLKHLSGMFPSRTLRGVPQRLADPAAMPLLESLPDIEAYDRDEQPHSEPIEPHILRQAFEGLRKRGVKTKLSKYQWNMWCCVDYL